MQHNVLKFSFIVSILLVAAGAPSPNATASIRAVAPDLGTAASFVVLAGATFTNTGPGVFYGDVGVSPGTSVTGFPPGEVRHGALYAGGAVPTQAQIGAVNAYNTLALQTCDTNLTGQDLGGMTLQPGVYCFNTSAQLTGDLVLDAMGDSNAVWVFKLGSTLTTASASSVRVIDGGQALNVFWQVGTSATLGTATRFTGNILADTSITLVAGASLLGRALALNGAVTMDTNGSLPIAIPITDLSIIKSIDHAIAFPGQLITYTLTFFNVGNVPVTDVMITDIIPISVTGTSVVSSGVLITPDGGMRYVWDIAPLAVDQGGVITITGQLSATLPAGIFTNTAVITTSALDSDGSNNSSSVGLTIAPMTYTLTVNIVGLGSVTREPTSTVSLPYDTYLAGTVVTLTAAPAASRFFSGFSAWTGDLNGTANPAQVMMDANKVITATFETRIYFPVVHKNNSG